MKEDTISAHNASRRPAAAARAGVPVATVLAAIAEPNRVRLLRLLLDADQCVSQCVTHTGLVQSLVSKHLGRLVDAGLVERRRVGRHSYHSVVDVERVRSLLNTADELARARTVSSPA